MKHKQDDGVEPAASPCQHLPADACQQQGPKDGGEQLTAFELDIAYGSNATPIWCRPGIRGLVRLPAIATRPMCPLTHHMQAPAGQPSSPAWI